MKKKDKKFLKDSLITVLIVALIIIGTITYSIGYSKGVKIGKYIGTIQAYESVKELQKTGMYLTVKGLDGLIENYKSKHQEEQLVVQRIFSLSGQIIKWKTARNVEVVR